MTRVPSPLSHSEGRSDILRVHEEAFSENQVSELLDLSK